VIAEIGTSDLLTVASILSAFGSAMLFFRIQRELTMHERVEILWIPWADWLLIGATLISLLAVILPIFLSAGSRLPLAAITAATVLVAGYVIAILAHYRLFLGFGRQGPRTNPEPAEAIIVLMVLLTATLVFARQFW
jgi:hypothetical protein